MTTMIAGREAHPVADLFPMLPDDELAALSHDIAARGLIHAVVIDGAGLVLDGRNRLLACEKAGVTPHYSTYMGEDPVGYAVAANVKRRHLTDGQRAALALDVLPFYAEQAALNVGGRPSLDDEENLPSRDGKNLPRQERTAASMAAKAVGTSARSVERAKRLQEQAPALLDKVRAGFPIKKAEQELRFWNAEQARAARFREDAERMPEQPTVDLRLGDFREVLADVRGVDAVITDPPYGQEWLHLLPDLAAWADDALTPEGHLLVLFGHQWLPDVLRLLDGHRPYRWMMCYLMPGPTARAWTAHVFNNWKPILVYGVPGEFGTGTTFQDVIEAKGGSLLQQEGHKWGQDQLAFDELVRRFCRPGQTVVDPFAGSGTTLLAARAHGCHAIGAELDPVAYDTAQRRLAL